MEPLAYKLRPNKLEDFVGQDHLIGKNKILTKMIESKKISNMIIYGPSGTGKTSIANIIAKECNKNFYKINGTTTNTDEIKKIINETKNFNGYSGIILYIDEIHFLSKKQQQIILEFIENGLVTLIGSTTENINFSIFGSILSRCITLNFKPLTVKQITSKLEKVLKEHFSEFNYTKDSLELIAQISGGDLRKSLNILELSLNTYTKETKIDKKHIEDLNQSNIKYSTDDKLYNNLSFLQKSIRGSDPNASTLALAVLLNEVSIEIICRRLLVIACEDIGLAYPNAISIVKSCTDSALILGMPEARIPLSQAVIFMSLLPKSNTCYTAINKALNDTTQNIEVPEFLCSEFSNNSINVERNYLYPHNYPNNYVKQNYMPKGFENKIYYEYGQNKFENSFKDYWDKLK